MIADHIIKAMQELATPRLLLDDGTRPTIAEMEAQKHLVEPNRVTALKRYDQRMRILQAVEVYASAHRADAYLQLATPMDPDIDAKAMRDRAMQQVTDSRLALEAVLRAALDG